MTTTGMLVAAVAGLGLLTAVTSVTAWRGGSAGVAEPLVTETPAVRATPEVRGTWLTTTANRALLSPENTAESMRRLREIGLNTVYIECWKNGYTEFPSPTMQRLIGVPLKLNNTPAELQRDLLHEAVVEAHRNGMLAIAWFEYGFMAAFKDTHNELRKLAEQEGWLTRTRDGELVGKQNPFVWMNPLHPKAQQLVLDITLDAVRTYDLDGIQLDDRIAMPVEMGYDDYTRALYAAEHDGRQPPDDPRDPAWVQWRADKITEYARRYAAAVREANPNLIISVSPAPWPWSLENYACDWPKWLPWGTGEGRWDEFVPQNYRFNFERTKASIEEQIAFIGDRRRDLLPGIRIVGDGPDMPRDDLIRSVQFTREAGLGGHVHWFSRGVLEVYPDALQAFYNVAQLGHAPHPARPADWRRLPSVARRLDGERWSVRVEVPGKYRVVARNASGVRTWRTVESRFFDAGEAVLTVIDADAVELLVDRRP
ncbi:MAG: glycoside hydrolase family 10 protein [Tepidisphaerales bacterium]